MPAASRARPSAFKWWTRPEHAATAVYTPPQAVVAKHSRTHNLLSITELMSSAPYTQQLHVEQNRAQDET